MSSGCDGARELSGQTAKTSDPATAVETRSYSPSEAILYALSVGVGSRDPADPAELKYLHGPNLQVLPTFATALLVSAGGAAQISRSGEDAGALLHSSESLTMHSPLPPCATIVMRREVTGLDSQTRAATRVCHEMRVAGEDRLVATAESEVVRRSSAPASARRLSSHPGRPTPTFTVDLPCSRNQALLYRLLGDHNPIHVDPLAARAAGYPAPILHGLVSYGMVCRALLKALCADVPQRLLEFSTRFTDVIFPGEALCLETWIARPGLATFRLRAPERDCVVQDFGRFRFSE